MEPKDYLEKFFATRKNPVTEQNRRSFDDFCKNEKYLDTVAQILAQQHMLMKDWEIRLKVDNIINQHVLIPNGSVGKPYKAVLDFEQWGWNDIAAYEVTGLENTGLEYDSATQTISGKPEISGDLKLLFRFRITAEGETEHWNEKYIPLIINPDPKSLWKDLPSDKEAIFWKPDNVAVAAALGARHIAVASKRGRSHANVGSFRDDDFAFKYAEDSGWSIIAVSDGAGSAKYSREGARIACEGVIAHFEGQIAGGTFSVLDNLLASQHEDADPDVQKEINQFVYNELGNGARHIHKLLEQTALKAEASLSDFHATLIFVLIRKYAFGYGVLSFGVGDCPIGLIYDNCSAVTLLNTLDVGEFGGGTRFITMPEIFQNENFSNRFGFRLIKDFDYLIMMTDGIYDPKFEVEANLTKPEKWQQFLADLKGENVDGKKVILEANNPELADQLSGWMDFWSPGNHDDRTLAILF